MVTYNFQEIEPDIPDPAQLDMLSCFFDSTDDATLPDKPEIKDVKCREKLTNNLFELNDNQKALAASLYEKSRALSSKINKNNQADE
jgi:hypothetical protein